MKLKHLETHLAKAPAAVDLRFEFNYDNKKQMFHNRPRTQQDRDKNTPEFGTEG